MKFENIRVFNFENALRGMRNPLESWHLSDSKFGIYDSDNAWEVAEEMIYIHKREIAKQNNSDEVISVSDKEIKDYMKNMVLYHDDDMYEIAAIGPKDMNLAQRLIRGGPEHRKFLRQIMITVDITAPLYWWKEADTYAIGVTKNSTSTMHKLASKPITLECFEIDDYNPEIYDDNADPLLQKLDIDAHIKEDLLPFFELLRQKYLETNDKRYWKELVRWLPNGWLQTRTVTMNYENILSICHQREHHKLTEWSGMGENESFMKFARSLPYANDLIFINNN